MFEGQKVVVEKIEIFGNSVTNEAVIRSEASVMSRIASKEEAGVFTDWLSQATGSERSFWDKIIRGFSADLYRGFKASTELSNVVNRIFSVTGLVAPAVPAIGLLYNAYNLEPIGPNEIGNLKVYTAEFFKNHFGFFKKLLLSVVKYPSFVTT